MQNVEKNFENLSFEVAIRELEEIVKGLESGNLELEKAISLYERGNNLKSICEKRLNEAKLKVEKITKNADGSPSLQGFSEN